MKRVSRQVLTAHILRECGGDLMDSPAMSAPHSPTIDVEYVLVPSNTITILRLF